MKLLARNKRATYDYEIAERIVAGLVLTGDEVKSSKAGHASLKGSYVILRADEAYLTNAHITAYAHAYNKTDIEPLRTRKLLLHRRQLAHLVEQKQAGMSVIPTALLLERGLLKLEIGIGRGKKKYDKREAIKRRDTSRELARNVVR